MSISLKYTYFWTIFCGIPFGIGMLVGAYDIFNSIENSVDAFPKTTGLIENYGEKEIYDKEIDTHYEVFFIQTDKGVFKEVIGEKRDLLRKYIPIAYKNKRKVTVWTKKNSSSIEQVAIENFIIYKYKPPYWMAITFLIIGLVFSIMGTIYLFKYYDSTWKTKRIK